LATRLDERRYSIGRSVTRKAFSCTLAGMGSAKQVAVIGAGPSGLVAVKELMTLLNDDFVRQPLLRPRNVVRDCPADGILVPRCRRVSIARAGC
jgi:hypothetical protein